jgi:hypothetical protein
MRYSAAICAAGVLWAQDASRSTTYTYDANGRRTPAAVSSAITSGSGSIRAETTQTINGRSVPLESVEEKVISDGPEGRVIERVVKRYGQNGQPGQPEKVRIEEKKQPGGGTTVLTTVFDSDINGRFAVRERSTMRTSQSGDTVNAQTLVERPSLSGSLDVVERREEIRSGDPKKQVTTDLTVYRKDTNGGFAQAERITGQTVVENNQTTQTTATYNTNMTGKLELAGQRVSRVQKAADGTELEVVDIFGSAPPGRTPQNGPVLREQQIIERRPGGGQALVETFSIRRPDLESGRLGPARKISETVCTGKCLPEPAAPAPKK